MKTVICMKWGARYGAEYANRLYSAVRRNVTGDLRFVCFTDDARGIVPEVEALPLPEIDLPERVRWLPWRKVSLWRAPLGPLTNEEVLFLDLDVVITGALDPFFDYAPGKTCIIENWTQLGEGIGNTTCYRFRVGAHTEIYDAFTADPGAILSRFRASQQFVSASLSDKVYWPAEWCVSFKHTLMPKFPMNWLHAPELPPETRLVAFTGHPDPDEARDGRWPAPLHKRLYKHVRPTPWITEHWR